MGNAFPEWVYEAFGTMFFTMTMCSAWGANGVLHNSLAVGISWALINAVFSSHCKAHFNPLFSVAEFVRSEQRDFLDLLKTVFGQYVGCALGIGLLERLAGPQAISESVDVAGTQHYVLLFVLAAFLVKFFFSEEGKKFWPDHAGMWAAVAIAVVHMIGGSDADSNMANPAVYTGAHVQNVIQSVVDGGEFDAFSFFEKVLLQNISLYFGAIVSVLVTAYEYKGK